MVYAQPRIHPEKWDGQNTLVFCDTEESSNLGQVTKPSDHQQKKRTCRIVDFVVPADHWVKLKESKKRDEYVYLSRELKKLCNLKVTVLPILNVGLDIVTKGLVQRVEDLEIRGQVETVQKIAVLRSTRILRRVLET